MQSSWKIDLFVHAQLPWAAWHAANDAEEFDFIYAIMYKQLYVYVCL